jgi:flagellar biosynthesis protein FliP
MMKWMCLISALLMGLALVSTMAHAEPYSCQMYREAARKCAANTIGKCYVEDDMERLRKQCLRDGGNP